MARQHFTTKDVADVVGCDRATVCKNASKHGIGDKHGLAWWFTETEVRSLLRVIRDGPGRPKKGRGK